ncbi:hypothetical protein, partial [Chryseobacterium sp. CH1]|uniref:hypothetical protein n=1 Tax=Chryseobacterium sp. CH1 TaxID=713551 RepID=UPI00102539B5
SYTPSGPGNIIEILNQNGGCLSTNERYTVWYTFTVSTPGTLAFKIKPNDQGDDYDLQSMDLQQMAVLLTPLQARGIL